MSSAFAGVRIVARALPGSGGSAARARASAACFAAWRAAQGAAPRRPSLRFGGSGVLSALCAPRAPFFAELFASAALPFAAFLVVAISIALIPVRSPSDSAAEIRGGIHPDERLRPAYHFSN